MKKQFKPFLYKNIILRLITSDDLETMRNWRNRDDIRMWFKTTNIISQQQQLEWFQNYQEKDNDFVFMVTQADMPNERLGQASVYNIAKDRSAEVGRFIVNPNERSKGYMTLACEALVHICYNYLDLSKLYLEVLKNNRAAISIYERCGFKIESEDLTIYRMEQKIIVSHLTHYEDL